MTDLNPPPHDTPPDAGTSAYLSRVWLNPLRQSTQRLINDPQSLHAAVLGGLALQPVTERVLWRLEPAAHRVEVFVLTRQRPSWEHLVEQAGWPGADTPQAVVAACRPLLERLAIGQEYTFRLRANPVSSTVNPASPSTAQKTRLGASDRPRGVVVAHRTVEHQLRWFTDRVEGWGLRLLATSQGDPQVEIVGRDRLSFTKRSRTGATTHRVTLQTVTYQGRVQILDTALATRSLLEGVGRAKAYGCGLLTLAPAAR